MPVVSPDDFEIDLLMFLIPSGIYDVMQQIKLPTYRTIAAD
jgi:hypothetical protein